MQRALVVALVLLLPAGLAGCGGGDGDQSAEREGVDCGALSDEAARTCYAEAFKARVAEAEDPLAEVEAITAESRAEGGFLLSNCHGIMHGVGRSYAASRDVTLESLMEHLPQSNDPGCPAGFAHGVVTAVAPQLYLSDPRGSASVCADADTRYQRYSCVHGFGHAFMRAHGDELEPALELCRALGPESPDCAQAPSTTTGSPWPASTTRSGRRRRRPIRRFFVRTSRTSSYGRAGTGRSSTGGRKEPTSRPRATSTGSARRSRACNGRRASRPRP